MLQRAVAATQDIHCLKLFTNSSGVLLRGTSSTARVSKCAYVERPHTIETQFHLLLALGLADFVLLLISSCLVFLIAFTLFPFLLLRLFLLTLFFALLLLALLLKALLLLGGKLLVTSS